MRKVTSLALAIALVVALIAIWRTANSQLASHSGSTQVEAVGSTGDHRETDA